MGDRYRSPGRGRRRQKIENDRSFGLRNFTVERWLMYTQASTASSTRLQKLLTLNQLVEASIPQVYWTGYESLVLVSAHFIAKWSVTVTKDPMSNIFPRRWLDIRGNRVPSFWQAALRAVMGSVIFRPGISQVRCFNAPISFDETFFLGRN